MPDPDADHSEGGLTPEETRPTHLTDEAELDAFRAAADVALLQFYTDGCGICQSMEPVLGNVARDLNLPIGLINPREDPPLIERFTIRSVPTHVLFVDGDPVARRADGFISGDALTAWVQEDVDQSS